MSRLVLPLCLCVWALAACVAPAVEFSDGPWRYTFEQPPENWHQRGFDARQWRTGFGGFGDASTPGARVGTQWMTDDIWLRRTFELPEIPSNPALLIHHDEDAEVYLNGQQVAKFDGYLTAYRTVPLDAQGKAALRMGRNLLAVHCHQTGGGQFIDVHVVDADNVPKLPPPTSPTEPFDTDLITRWGAEVTPENAWPEYPRPQMVRQEWTNLNGLWEYAISGTDSDRPQEWAGQILVPFCLESKLSGVGRLLAPTEALWYRRTFQWQPRGEHRTLLNFEAVDYRCTVWVNGRDFPEHVGGNLPFSIDITDALKEGQNELVVRVEDATGGAQLRGKQRLDPHGIWYTRVSGIWQTVWLEQVPARSFADLKITTDVESSSVTVRPMLRGTATEDEKLEVELLDGGQRVASGSSSGEAVTLQVASPKLWSPSSPHLYDLKLTLRRGDGTVVDQVQSYTGIRSVGKQKDRDGHWRFTLNGEIIFHWGTLDQGWWPDGLLTPPSDEALLSDVEFLKDAGFNMIRKHIKVEPRRFYYHCDRLGMMVWQDHVSGGESPPWTRMQPDPSDAQWAEADHEQFMQELKGMIDTLGNSPSIVVWVPFNEAWGQHRTEEVGRWVSEYDPTRLVNIASGGNFWPVGDIADHHQYPHPGFPFDADRFRDFILVVGEFGGHGWPVAGHLYDESRRNWGYGGLPKTEEEYKERYRESLRLLKALKDQGIAAGVYTQTTDVEGEINGLLTYDREVAKIPAQELTELHQSLLAE